jgi:hypothetical protein
MKQALVLLAIVSAVVQSTTANSESPTDVAAHQSRRLFFWRKPMSQADVVLSLDLINVSSGRNDPFQWNGD